MVRFRLPPSFCNFSIVPKSSIIPVNIVVLYLVKFVFAKLRTKHKSAINFIEKIV
jgi:hypothetical protein